jgi:secondary thiamine-phosphate synthase enzyme
MTGVPRHDVDVIIPQVGEAIAEATLVRWHKQEGDPVQRGDVLFEIDLDKATVEVEAFEDGVLGQILVPEDSPVTPLQKVAVLLVEGPAQTTSSTAPPGSGGGSSSPASTEPGEAPAPGPVDRPSSAAPVSPRARRLAQELGVPLSDVQPTGEDGMISVADVERTAALRELAGGDGDRPPDASAVVAPATEARGLTRPEREPQSLMVVTERKYEVVDITDEVAGLVPPGADGLAFVYLKHTTAALLLGPNDDGMRTDFERVAEHWLGSFGPFEHTENNNPNGEAHALSSFGGTQLTIPVDGGRLDLGTWQRVLLLEMDGPLRRTVNLRLMPSHDEL